ncbi:MAG: hypothetical protein JW952_05480, partial [Candidatus Eisenbacteria bacterium]|nr:hypothetical protein [Candidatus Eisenbacteria bacterium]
MKKRMARVVVFVCAHLCILAGAVELSFAIPEASMLAQKFHLAGPRSQETQYFLMESQLINYAPDGTRAGKDVFRLRLECVPGAIAGKDGDEYTCARFTVQEGNGPERDIPTLENWSYVFTGAGTDKKGQVFGIEHAKFDGLTYRDGAAIPASKSYHVYNAFIDFHGFCSLFPDSSVDGKGIQDLKRIGQTIVHSAAFSEPPVNLGENVSEGSFFKNGEITLTFKGLTLVDGRPCALVGYHSGESSFKMIMKPAPTMEIVTVGSSHYSGDISKDLETNWVRRATMTELVVSETTLPMTPSKIGSVIERAILIRN